MTTVVVVGSGPSLSGKGLGAEIDRHTVVRLHNWHWQGATDHGERCDYIVIPGPWGDRAYRDMERHPTEGYWVYWMPEQRLPKRAPHRINGLPVKTLDAQAVPELDGPVVGPRWVATRGFMAAVMAMEFLRPSRLLCAGLDAVLTGAWTGYSVELTPPEWWTEGSPISGDPNKGDREDFRREAPAIRALADRLGVEIEALC